MGFFKPAWQSENEEKALKAVEKETNQKKLEEIAQNAMICTVRKNAIFKLVNAHTDLYYDSSDEDGYPVRRKKTVQQYEQDLYFDAITLLRCGYSEIAPTPA